MDEQMNESYIPASQRLPDLISKYVCVAACHTAPLGCPPNTPNICQKREAEPDPFFPSLLCPLNLCLRERMAPHSPREM